MNHEWPGNVRELQNLVERHVALADTTLLPLQTELFASSTQVPQSGSIDTDYPDLRTLEKRYIDKMLQRFDGNREKTAAALGINKSTLWRKLQKQ